MKKSFKLFPLLLVLLILLSACGEVASSEILSENTSEASLMVEDVSVDLLVSSEESTEQSEESEASEVSKESVYQEGDFYILYTEDEVDFSKAPKAEISHYPWNDDYTPYAYGQVIFKKDDGFYIHMYCEESNPKTEVTEIGGNVYLDSALEFFCDYRPDKRAPNTVSYINLEMNSKGVYLANYGRFPVSLFYKKNIEIKGEVFDDHWTVTAHIPLELIKAVYGKFEIGIGTVVECNFTKCGSGTEIKHWGTWQRLSGDTPNFHQPKFFKKVEIRK